MTGGDSNKSQQQEQQQQEQQQQEQVMMVAILFLMVGVGLIIGSRTWLVCRVDVRVFSSCIDSIDHSYKYCCILQY
jgi:hypothetical protein